MCNKIVDTLVAFKMLNNLKSIIQLQWTKITEENAI